MIGNAAYSAVAPLANATSDARLIAGTLNAAGFRTTVLVDADQTTMKRAIADFGRTLRSAGADASGLFYYAGHGVQAGGVNYLIPVDAAIADAADLDLVAVDAAWVMRQLESARVRTAIVILDACRDNPFATQGLRETGLARMDAPAGSFVAYSTAPGDAAFDGAGANSPFTAALAREAARPGLTIEETFRRVRVSVMEETGGLQTPWTSSSLIDEFYFAGAPEEAETAAEKLLWERARSSNDLLELALFLRAYPESRYAEEAHRRLIASSDQLAEAGSVSRATPPAMAPAPLPPAVAAQDAAAFERARLAGRADDYRAYLEAFPSGGFTELAHAEIDALESSPPSPLDPNHAETEQLAALVPAPQSSSTASDTGHVTFDTPLPGLPDEFVGRSIREAIQGSPLHPPIEGLPPEAWSGKTCSSCHEWTQSALCDQGRFYDAGDDDSRIEGKLHPLGPNFLRGLRDWAAAGCL